MTDARGLRIALHQMSPRLLAPEDNLATMRAAADSLEADLHIFPEMSLTGYDLGSRSGEFAVQEGDLPPIQTTDGSTLVFGFPFQALDGRLFNAAGAVSGSEWQTIYRKVHLPTYGMFDEGRYFAPGRRAPHLISVAGFRVALAVCEDLWHPAVAWLAAMQGADLLVCPVAAAGRGFRTPDAESRFESAEAWVMVARTIALQHGMAVALCNRVGSEGSITFAGGSLLISPSGDVVAHASDCEEEILTGSLNREEVQQARRPFSHLRDADPQWVRREIERLNLAPDLHSNAD